MNIFKKIYSTIKNFHYKLITLFVGVAITGFLSQYLDDGILADVVNVLLYIFGAGLGIYMYVAIYHAFKNTWNDGDKILAIFYGFVAIAFIGLIIYLSFFAQ